MEPHRIDVLPRHASLSLASEYPLGFRVNAVGVEDILTVGIKKPASLLSMKCFAAPAKG